MVLWKKYTHALRKKKKNSCGIHISDLMFMSLNCPTWQKEKNKFYFQKAALNIEQHIQNVHL
jgi:hypothetical protein